jgi:hypothetical protein
MSAWATSFEHAAETLLRRTPQTVRQREFDALVLNEKKNNKQVNERTNQRRGAYERSIEKGREMRQLC